MNQRILLVNDYKSEGGAERVCRDIERLVKENGGEIEFFYGSKEYSLPRSAKDYVYSKEYYRKLKDQIKSFQPDVIHLHNFYHLLSPSILTAIKHARESGSFRGKVIMTAHDYHLLSPDSGFYYTTSKGIVSHKELPTFWDLVFKRYDNRSYTYSLLKKIQWIYNYGFLGNQDQIDLFLSPSNFLKKKYEMKFPHKDVVLVRNPFDIEVLEKEVDINEDREKLKLVFLGRLSPEKGVKEFIRSLASSSFEEYSLDIVGDGPDHENIEKLVSNLGLDNKICLHGRIPYDEVINKIKDYDVLVVPSLWVENAPLVIVEAVIAHLRILTCNWGGMKEMAELCGEYYFMDPRKKDSVEKALKKAKQEVLIEKKNINRNIEEIKSTFSSKKFTQKLLDIYSSID